MFRSEIKPGTSRIQNIGDLSQKSLLYRIIGGFMSYIGFIGNIGAISGLGFRHGFIIDAS